jgi:Reverse transcriptase (RNA-dependent DNA polymerase).
LICQHIDPNASIPSPIQLDQIHHIAHIFKTGEEIKYQPRVDAEWFRYFDELVQQLTLTADEYILKTSTSQFTCKQLMQRDDFNQCREAEFKQLDTHESDGMFGKPCPRPPKAIVLRSIWTYILKWDSAHKARNCGNGRPLRNDLYRRLEAVYTACVSQVGVKIFFAVSALMNYVIYDLDAVNAFGQAGKLFHLIYLEIDQQYKDWYKNRKGENIPDGWVLPVLGLLQGHPDSGEVWQNKINNVIASYGFTATTHEPCLYQGVFQGNDILICRQVNDMVLAGKDPTVVQAFTKELSTKLKVTFNGLDIVQNKEGIQINCSTYLEKLRKAHGWNEVSNRPIEPISPSKVEQLESTEGSKIDSPEGQLLQKRNGFNYRGVVG